MKWNAWLMLAVFFSYFTGSSFFLHSHTIDGVTIVHSHFHQEKHHSGQTGNHTGRELALISELSHFDKPLAGKTGVHEFQLTEFRLIKYPDLTPGERSASFHYISLRAPPLV